MGDGGDRHWHDPTGGHSPLLLVHSFDHESRVTIRPGSAKLEGEDFDLGFCVISAGSGALSLETYYRKFEL